MKFWCVNNLNTFLFFYERGSEILVFGSSALTAKLNPSVLNGIYLFFFLLLLLFFIFYEDCTSNIETWALRHSGLLQLLTLIKPKKQKQKNKIHKDKPGKTVMNFEGRSRPIKRDSKCAACELGSCVCVSVCVWEIREFLQECRNRPNPENDVFNR